MLKGVPTHNIKENFDTNVKRNYTENNLVPRANVMAIRSLKFRNYTVRVEKIPCQPYRTKSLFTRTV